MKNKLILLLISCSTFVFSQDETRDTSSLSIENYTNIYVLDSGFVLNQRFTWVNADNRVNFLMINNGDALLTSSMRKVGVMKTHQFFGEMDGLKISKNKENQKVISFFARAREFRVGQVRSFEITILPNDRFIIQYFDKLGTEQFFFYARFPNEDEEKEIKELFNSF